MRQSKINLYKRHRRPQPPIHTHYHTAAEIAQGRLMHMGFWALGSGLGSFRLRLLAFVTLTKLDPNLRFAVQQLPLKKKENRGRSRGPTSSETTWKDYVNNTAKEGHFSGARSWEYPYDLFSIDRIGFEAREIGVPKIGSHLVVIFEIS